MYKLQGTCWNPESEEGQLSDSKNATQGCLNGVPNSTSEEQLLDTAFEACDTEGRGEVTVFQIIDYLKSVTDQPCDGDRLQHLCKMLDPEEQGRSLDLPTFRKVMSEWIASCCSDSDITETVENIKSEKGSSLPCGVLEREAEHEGYGGDVNKFMGEHADFISKIRDLSFANKKLMDQKMKLQKSLETADETNSHLLEEISEVKSKLKISQQAVNHSRSLSNELEDLKAYTKTLEDKIAAFGSQKEELEKDNLSLCNQRQMLQEEMYNLLIDKENLKGNIDSLSAEKDNMGLQICEYESLISQKEMLLEEVLQREKRLLHEQLLQPNKENMPLNQSVSVKQLPLPVQSVHRELEEIQEQKIRVKSELLSPICGIPQASGSNVLCPIQDTDMTSDDAWAVTELLLVQLKQGTEALIRSVHEMTSSDQSVSYLYEQSGHFLLELNYLLELKNVWERQWGRLGRAVQLYTGKEAKEPDSEELPATEWYIFGICACCIKANLTLWFLCSANITCSPILALSEPPDINRNVFSLHRHNLFPRLKGRQDSLSLLAGMSFPPPTMTLSLSAFQRICAPPIIKSRETSRDPETITSQWNTGGEVALHSQAKPCGEMVF
uniref:Coiled-coil domain containing 155 like n=1 Tax=Xenopus tropicalis TaxID=8364 RepID=A0A803JHV2_XENTR